MRRLIGGVAVLGLLLAACSGEDNDTVADEAPATTEAPAAASTTSTTSEAPTGAAVPGTAGGELCLPVDDIDGTSIELCARDLGFPGIRGAAFSHSGAALAIVDPDVVTVSAHIWSEGQERLEVQVEDGLAFVTAPYADELEAVAADGMRYRHGPQFANEGLPDGSMLVTVGEGEAWSLWFTRYEAVCVEYPVLNGPSELLCTDAERGYELTGSWVVVAEGEHCYPAEVGYAVGVGPVDPGSTGTLVVDNLTVDTNAVTLPNGELIGWAIGEVPVGVATAQLSYQHDGEQRTVDFELPIPPPQDADYPQGCPYNGPPEADYPTPPTAPPVTYPEA